MQGAGDGRELSITFQTSGKAVRLSAPEKWRKAVAGEDLKPDSWVEIHRQGGSPQTVQANDVPELHALFVELGLAPEAPPAAVADLQTATGEAAVDHAEPSPILAPAPPLAATSPGFGGGQAAARESGRRDQLGPEGRRIGGGIAAFIIGLVVLTNILRGCDHHAARADLPASASQLTIAVDSSAPPQSPPSFASGPDTHLAEDAAVEAAMAAPAPKGESTAAASPSFDCGRVTSDNLKLVCATPDLATADRTLAAAYKAALAAASDPAEVRDSERDWIAARNAAPADVDQLRALYADRIRVLRDAAKVPEPF